MNVQEYRQLQAERATLENLLKQLPASSVIETKGFGIPQEGSGRDACFTVSSLPATRSGPFDISGKTYSRYSWDIC